MLCSALSQMSVLLQHRRALAQTQNVSISLQSQSLRTALILKCQWANHNERKQILGRQTAQPAAIHYIDL